MKGVTRYLLGAGRGDSVSIHTPNEGSDAMWTSGRLQLLLFQSTLPMKGVTGQMPISYPPPRFQSTLPMKGVTVLANAEPPLPRVSIHTPNEGSDHILGRLDGLLIVSIHTPNEGSDTPRA